MIRGREREREKEERMASNFKNDRAWTPQDVKALDCAMMNQLEIGFTSIDRDEIPNPNKLPLDAKPTDFMGRKLELEKSIFINSSILTKEMVAKVENAKENDDKEVLNTVLKQHIDTICKETFLITMETTNHFQIGSLSLKIKSLKHYQPKRRTGGKSSEAN